jgi:plastocyanin
MYKIKTVRVAAISAALILATNLAACSTGITTAPSPTVSINPATTIVISNYGFSTIAVPAGSTITVVNKDGVDHSVNVNGTATDPQVGAGETKTFKAPLKAGIYKLTCDFHQAMHGTLTVTK